MDLLNGSETESHLNTVEALMLLFIHELDVADDVAKWSRFHDIGKRDIPKEILYKEGQLTLAERKMVEKHPMLGLKYIGLLTKEKKEQTWLESISSKVRSLMRADCVSAKHCFASSNV